MSRKSLGLIETIGLTAAVEAADAAVKSACVELVGYELTKGSGMTVVKVEGNVGAVKAAIDAAAIAASRVGIVVSTKVIPRPDTQIGILIRNRDTVGGEEETGTVETKAIPVETGQAAAETTVWRAKAVMEAVLEEPEVQPESQTEIVETLGSAELELGEQKVGSEGAEDGKQPSGVYTCNICKDPSCPRLKGDRREMCVHYRPKR